MMRTIISPYVGRPLLLAALGCLLLCGLSRTTIAQNTVLVADALNSRVLSYNVNASNDWSFNGIFAQSSDGSNLVAPGPILWDGADAVYIGETNVGNDASAARILKYDLSGQFQNVVTTFAGEIPDHFVMAPDGNLLVSNPFGDNGFERNNIYKVNVGSGSVSEFIAEPDPLFFPSPDYRLDNPRGMAIAGTVLYVANRNAMGSQAGSILRFNAATGAYLDAGIGPDAGAFEDDVFGDFDNPQAVHHDAATNNLIISVFGGGQDIFTIDLAGSAAMAPPIPPNDGGGVTKVYNPNDTGFVLDIHVINGVTYWSSFQNGAVYRLDTVDERTEVVSGLGNGFGLEEIPFQGIGSGELEWLVDGFGDWNSPNWLGGQPIGNTAVALLGGAIQADTSIYMDDANTVKSLRFDNANKYAVVGVGPLTFEADTGNASILVDNGSHEFQTPVILASDTDVTVAAGTQLAFNNQLDLNGFTLSISGDGTVDFNNAVVTGGGGILTSVGASLLGAESLGSLVTVVPEPASAVILLSSYLLMAVRGRSPRRI